MNQNETWLKTRDEALSKPAYMTTTQKRVRTICFGEVLLRPRDLTQVDATKKVYPEYHGSGAIGCSPYEKCTYT